MICDTCHLTVEVGDPIRIDRPDYGGPPVVMHVGCVSVGCRREPKRVFDCGICGRRVEVGFASNKAFCSPACQARRKHKRNAPMVTWLAGGKCYVCRAPLTGRRDQRTCGTRCRVALSRQRKRYRARRGAHDAVRIVIPAMW